MTLSLRQALDVLREPDQVVEVRVLGAPKGIASGYFNDMDKLEAAVRPYDGRAEGNYITLNPVNPALIARANNRMRDPVRHEPLTTDDQVSRRRWLLIDGDPVRPKGISSTDDEHRQAHQKVHDIASHLTDQGWPAPVMADSGNGAHLLYRVDLPNDPSSRDLIERCLKALALRFSDPAVAVDTSVANAARITKLYGTVTRKGDATAERPHRRSGMFSVAGPVDVVPVERLKALADQVPIATTPRPSVAGRGSQFKSAEDVARWLADHTIAVHREATWQQDGHKWVLKHCPWNDEHRDHSAYVVRHANGAMAAGCHHDGCVDKDWKALRALFKEMDGPAEIVQASTLPDTFPLTESGDAEYFAASFGDQIRFDWRRHRWLIFIGHRWVPDADGELHRLAKQAIRDRQAAALSFTKDDERKARLRWATAGESRKRIENMIALARSVKPISDTGDSWDTDPWLLGVLNGVLDLRDGTVRPGRPDDRITMCIQAPFDPQASCDLWITKVQEIFDNRADLIDYVHRALGYSLTGITTEQCLFLNWGSGANGKGTLINTFGWLLGDYADDLPFSALELHQRASIPNDVAKLVGRRFVTSSESNDGVQLNEARIKALTGCDPITARFMRAEFFTFQPVAKFWLATNHKPAVRDDSYGFWRRMRLIPFTQQFEGVKDDKDLKEKLKAEAAGILRWAVDGCLKWQQHGLQAPATVVLATREYEQECDPLAAFFESRCLLDAKCEVRASTLYKAYERWCFGRVKERDRMSMKRFGQQIRKRGFEAREDSEHRVSYFGIGLLKLTDLADDQVAV